MPVRSHRAPRRGRWRAFAAWLALAMVLATYLHLCHAHATEDRTSATLCGFCASQARDLAPISTAPALPVLAAPRWIETVALTTLVLDLTIPLPRARGPPSLFR